MGSDICPVWLNHKSTDPLTQEQISLTGKRFKELFRMCRPEVFSPTSGSEPSYQPEIWNDPDVVKRFNCYDYAFNNLNPKQTKKTQPGEPSQNYDEDERQRYQCSWIGRMMKLDNPTLELTTFDEQLPNGYYKVALLLDKYEPHLDYHFLRQDKDGFWSHKPGTDPITNVDADNKLIYNPEKANLIYDKYKYATFCSYFKVPVGSYKIFANKKNNRK